MLKTIKESNTGRNLIFLRTYFGTISKNDWEWKISRLSH